MDKPPARRTSLWTAPAGAWLAHRSPALAFGLTRFACRTALQEETKKTDNPYELYGKLEKLDKRVKVPFAWFFYMLHGNRVDDAAGKRVLAAAEAGQIVLPEHDYRVLKAWRTHPYGF